MNSKAILAIVAAGVLVAGTVAALAFAGPPAASSNTSKESPEEMVSRLTTPTIPSAYALGSPDAKVTIVEFGDYLCTFCHRFHQDTKDQLVANYVDTGKVRFVFKDFPINDHLAGGSTLGARASYCAADQNKFWEFHDGMYNNWGGEKAGWITKENMLVYARNAGVADIDQFKSCLDSNKYADVVRENYRLAQSIGLDATPSFIIIPADGGQPTLIRGAYPYSAFQQVIDDASSSS
ncbi:thioredoxin domain-containing protein [Nitrososphaera sp.]|uniref:DsbA family protein n=1 Tax=Nitrososphaera sp. TaxID=1971748 RepID=UPI00307D6993